MASNNVECLVIDIKDISRIQKEFPEYYDDLLNEQIFSLQKAWIYKLKALKTCRQQLKDFELLDDGDDQLNFTFKALYIY